MSSYSVKNNPLKYDPSQTGTLRRQFSNESIRRWTRIQRAIYQLIQVEDIFGLAPLMTNQRYRFRSSSEKLRLFQEWLKVQTVAELGLDPGVETKGWWRKYIQDGYQKGAARTFDDLNRRKMWNTPLDFYRGTKEEFLRSAFSNPVSQDKVDLLASRVFTELRGVTEATSSNLTRLLTDGITQGESPRTVARKMSKSIEDISKKRASTIARTETVRAHAEGQLTAMENLGVEEIGVAVEWTITPDARVCPSCVAMNGVVLSLSEARGLLPRHPNCRCAFIPANVGESKKNQKRTQEDVRKALDESIQKTDPKRSLEEARQRSSWVGADLKGSEAPKSILDTPLPAPAPPTPIQPTPPTVQTWREKLATDNTLEEYVQKAQRYEDHGKVIKENWDKYRELHKKVVPGIAVEDFEKISAQMKELKDRNYYLENRKQDNTLFYISNLYNTTFDRSKIKPRITNAVVASYKAITKNLFVSDPVYKSMDKKATDAADLLERIIPKTIFKNIVQIPVYVLRKGERAFYTNEKYAKGVYLEEENKTEVYAHEMGHYLEEHIPGLEKKAQEFLAYRIQQSGSKDIKMKDICPTCNYDDSEVGNPDDFEKTFVSKSLAAYTGKTYSSGQTEVISMGVQLLYADPVGFARRDPEYFKFIVGTLKGIL